MKCYYCIIFQKNHETKCFKVNSGLTEVLEDTEPEGYDNMGGRQSRSSTRRNRTPPRASPPPEDFTGK